MGPMPSKWLQRVPTMAPTCAESSARRPYHQEGLQALACLLQTCRDERLSSGDVFHETSVRYRTVEPSSGPNVIPRRARPGLAGLGFQAPACRHACRDGRWSHCMYGMQGYLAHKKLPPA